MAGKIKDDLAFLRPTAVLLGEMQIESGEAAKKLRDIIRQLREGNHYQSNQLRAFRNTPEGKDLEERVRARLVADKHPLFQDIAAKADPYKKPEVGKPH